MVRVYLTISREAADALGRLADRELRDYRKQAQLLLEQAIRERCGLPTESGPIVDRAAEVASLATT
jgi:hypothetical protein